MAEVAQFVIPESAGVGAGVRDVVAVAVSSTDGVCDGVPDADVDCDGVCDGDEPGDGVCELVGVLVPLGVGEHESATARPVAAQPPHGHGSGAADASGQ